MFQRFIKHVTDTKEVKSKECADGDSKCEGEKKFEKSVTEHQDAHGRRMDLSEGIVEHIRSNGNSAG